MMQQGLGALMPQQPAGQAPENPVRMAAAMDVVTSDAEEQVLDPRTLALIKYKDAVAAMQAADQLMAASQPTPTPPTVAERTKLAAQQGIMGLASRLAPGLQQQGNRMAQQAGGGGLPQLSAPNMAGMARGGIVGYADGGAVDTDVQRYIEQYRAIMAAVQNASTPEQKAQLQQRLREIQSTFNPETVARAHMQMSGQGMANGGAVRGFGPGGAVEFDEQGNPITPPERSYQDILAAGQRQALESGMASMGADPEAQARAASARLQELAGLQSLMDDRKAAQQKLREIQEAQFSPEQQRRRLLRAALASGAEHGVGGFGRGYAAEEGRIAQEQQAAQQGAVADMDKLIADLRSMGLSQFEAEQQARLSVESGRNQGMSTVQALATANQQAEEARLTRESADTRASEQNRAQIRAAEIAGQTDTDNMLRILTENFMRTQGVSRSEAEYLAAEQLQQNEIAIRQAAAVAVDPTLQRFQRVAAVEEIRNARLKGIESLMLRDPPAYITAKEKIDEDMSDIMASIDGGGTLPPPPPGGSGSRFSVEQVN